MTDASVSAIQFLSRRPATPDFAAIAAHLTHRVGRTEFIPNEQSGGKGGMFVCHEYTAELKDGRLPVTILTVPIDGFNVETYADSLMQSWEWPQAKFIVPELRGGWAIHDMLGAALPVTDRLNLLSAVIEGMLTYGLFDALHWFSSRQFVNPLAYLANLNADDPNPYFGAVNVRLFNVQSPDGKTREMLMDSLGLAPFGLPDVQCHFAGLDPSAVANTLYSIAYYLMEHGDVIQDGHTVQGIKASDKWRCNHEDALVKPERVVLDLDPGPPYAAGQR